MTTLDADLNALFKRHDARAAAAAAPPIPLPFTLDDSQTEAVAEMQRGKNVFLTGNAGTGKSTVICTFLGQSFRRVDVTATTGIAALNLRDQFYARSGVSLTANTVYRWAGIDIGPQGGMTDSAFFESLRHNMHAGRQAAFRRVRAAECLVIDEISMLPGRTLTYLEYHCRQIRDSDKPWGGIQVIVVGDFLQLPPVAKSGTYDWAFLAPGWAASGFKPVMLQRIHRQADPLFTGLLNAIRVGHLSAEHSKLMATRVAVFPPANLLRLFTHNVQVDKWNAMRLSMIEEAEVDYNLTTNNGPEAAFLRKNILAPDVLKLKVGARVMVLVNLSQDGVLDVVNGALGTVVEMQPDAVQVKLDDGRLRWVEQYVWHADYQEPHRGTVTQFPLRLAWATSIHKSQGLSLDSALIDARAAREPGQTYVALSRVRSLAGLWLRDTFAGIWVSPEAIKFTNSIARRSHV